MTRRAVVFDIDGTLVDSNFHHLLAWSRAFGSLGIGVELWRLHGYLGMGGDQLVAAVAGEETEGRYGDKLRDRWSHEYDDLLDEVRPFPQAAKLLAATAGHDVEVVLATSGQPDHTSRALALLGLNHSTYPIVTGDDVDTTKPDPELVTAALDKVGATDGVLVGDTVWDAEAAGRAGIAAIGLRTGGIAEQVLRDAGAREVHDDPAALLDDLSAALDRVCPADAR